LRKSHYDIALCVLGAFHCCDCAVDGWVSCDVSEIRNGKKEEQLITRAAENLPRNDKISRSCKIVF